MHIPTDRKRRVIDVPVRVRVKPERPLGVATAEVQYDPNALRFETCNADPNGDFDLELCNEIMPGRIRLNVIAPAGVSGKLDLGSLRFTRLRRDGPGVRIALPIFADVNGNAIADESYSWPGADSAINVK